MDSSLENFLSCSQSFDETLDNFIVFALGAKLMDEIGVSVL